jgi:ribose transport system substrate-binding protein
MKRVIASTLAVLLLGLSMSACSAKTSTPTKSTSASNISKQLYIEVSAISDNDYFYDHQLGMKQVGIDLGVRTQYIGPTTLDINAMIGNFDQAIAEKPSGIVVVGFDSSLDVEVNKAMAAGIPVVTVDADLPSSNRIAFVGTGNINAGLIGGAAFAKAIGGKGEVAILTVPGQSNLEDRVTGYREAFSKFPDIKIVQTANTNSDAVTAAQAATGILQKYPNLAGFICVEAAGGSGAATAVTEAKATGKVKIISMDRSNDVLQSIESGVITDTVVQQTALMPYYAVEILYNIVNHKLPISTNNKLAGVTGTPVNIDTGCTIVDKSNAQYFMRTK